MTHEEKFRSLLVEWGITPYTYDIESTHRVVLAAREGNVDGYMGFEAIFDFNDDGSFSNVGVWE